MIAQEHATAFRSSSASPGTSLWPDRQFRVASSACCSAAACTAHRPLDYEGLHRQIGVGIAEAGPSKQHTGRRPSCSKLVSILLLLPAERVLSLEDYHLEVLFAAAEWCVRLDSLTWNQLSMQQTMSALDSYPA